MKGRSLLNNEEEETSGALCCQPAGDAATPHTDAVKSDVNIITVRAEVSSTEKEEEEKRKEDRVTATGPRVRQDRSRRAEERNRKHSVSCLT